MSDTVTIEYFHYTNNKYVRITLPRSELLEGGNFIVKGIERYGARIVEDSRQ